MYYLVLKNNFFSPNNKPEQIETSEEKTELKPDEKNEPKPGCSKQDDSADKAGRTGNNDSGNCYW